MQVCIQQQQIFGISIVIDDLDSKREHPRSDDIGISHLLQPVEQTADQSFLYGKSNNQAARIGCLADEKIGNQRVDGDNQLLLELKRKRLGYLFEIPERQGKITDTEYRERQAANTRTFPPIELFA